MANLGYTWYPKDWTSSDHVFELTLQERGFYRELIDIAMLSDNKFRIKISIWSRRFNESEDVIQGLINTLVRLSLLVIYEDYASIPSCEKRLVKIRAGRKGGKQSRKQNSKQNDKQNSKQTSNQIEKEKEKESKTESKEFTEDLFFNPDTLRNAKEPGYLGKCFQLYEKYMTYTWTGQEEHSKIFAHLKTKLKNRISSAARREGVNDPFKAKGRKQIEAIILEVAEKGFKAAGQDEFWKSKSPWSVIKNFDQFLDSYKKEDDMHKGPAYQRVKKRDIDDELNVPGLDAALEKLIMKGNDI